MARAKLAVTLEEKTLAEVDALVRRRVFPNRSRIIERAVQEKLARLSRNRLATECALLDPAFEAAMAEEDFTSPGLPRQSWIKISQIRTLAVERIGQKITEATPEEVAQVVEGLNEIVG